MTLGQVLATRARRDEVDLGDHPPITPVKAGTQKQCDGEVSLPHTQHAAERVRGHAHST